jgi:exodeoxyribonuclease V gamma subunit
MPGIRLFTSNRLEVLADALVATMHDAPLAPLQPEVVAVQSRGMARYVSFAVARRLGVCAHVRFPFPNALIDMLFSVFFERVPSPSPFDRDALSWTVLGQLDQCADAPGFERVNAYRARDPHGVKSLQLAGRIADVFDQYAAFRPDMLAAWSAGDAGDDPDERWQAELWRRIVKSADAPHRVALRDRLIDAVRTGALPASLPPRIALFGAASLPRLHLDICAALSQCIDISFFVMNPTEHFWDDIRADKRIDAVALRSGAHAPARLHLESAHPLLASCGDHGREFLAALHNLDCDEQTLFVRPGPRCLLEHVQADIFNLDVPESRRAIDRADRSVQIHSCHGPLREIETLHDNLLDLFERIPELRPHEIVVMTPDIETYGPYIQAVFDAPGESAPRIPYCIADRSVRGQSRVVDDFLRLLDIPARRFAADEVRGLLASPLIQAAAGISDEDLALIDDWIEETRIRWGVDAHSRAGEQLPATDENSWRAGLDRLLLGFAMERDGFALAGGTLPARPISGDATRALGALVAFIEELFALRELIASSRPLAQWADALDAVAARFFAPETGDSPEADLLRAALSKLAEQAALSAHTAPVSFQQVRHALERQLATPAPGSGFLSGGVTFCAMLPMRGVPFEVVCMIGMNDRAFPRQDARPSFSLLSRYPRPGDRNTRTDDKYVFLEALLSARRMLYISYAGQSARDNTARPPSVLVSELLDYCDQYYAGEHQRPVSRQLTVRHRLQPFSPDYFSESGPLFSYSDARRRAARALCRPPVEPPPFFIGECAAPEADAPPALTVEQLCSFFAHPTRWFVRQTLGVSLKPIRAALDAEENFTLHSRDRFLLEQLLLEHALRGDAPTALLAPVRRLGLLPHGAPGDSAFAAVAGNIAEAAACIRSIGAPGDPPWIDCAAPLAHRAITGRLQRRVGAALVRYRYAQISPRDRLEAWISHLLRCASAAPGAHPETILLGIVRRRTAAHNRTEQMRIIRYSHAPDASALLAHLADLYDQGLRTPLRFFPAASLRFAERVLLRGAGADSARAAAAALWHASGHHPGEGDDPYYRLCWEHDSPFEADFDERALAIYGPLLAHERECADLTEGARA